MADGVIHVLPEGIGQEQYDGVNQKLDAQGSPPAGLRFHAAGQGEDGRWRIIEVWESEEQFRTFVSQTFPKAVAKLGGMGDLSAPPVQQFELRGFLVYAKDKIVV